ncbi:hypothetical protein ONZ51_g10156 [Trametes cubensis]|uniref:Protein kinase domain-containing protein n=1 Tax=Trametes cubensis TaxID=1111947 RepID=A0AAD7TK21_9APHY|nr:hypothetical protein ONZ51_g10156 [Trametes cubensis]
MKDTQAVVEPHDNPPWYAREPDGSILCSGVPERLVRHPELVKRGIGLDYALKPGVVFESIAKDEGPGDRGFVVKVLDLEDEELEIYERLLGCLDSPQNHTIPCEIVRNGHPMLIMPMLSRMEQVIIGWCKSFGDLADVFYQLIEGVAFLHKHHIAHMDLCFGNVGGALSSPASYHAVLQLGRIYIYDFNTSRQFPCGPDSQCAITLPETQTPPPDGLTHFDPYSWDVYCLGVLLTEFMDLYAERKPSPPWILPIVTSVAHIISQLLTENMDGITPAHRAKFEWARTAGSMIEHFRGFNVHEVLGQDNIHSPKNAFTACADHHGMLDQLDIWLTPALDVQSQVVIPDTYDVECAEGLDVALRATRVNRQVVFRSLSVNGKIIPAPDPRLIELHAACAQIVHRSGAAELLREFYRDTDNIAVMTHPNAAYELSRALRVLHLASATA